MVFMPDSERAAALAADIGIPVGLHLNVTEKFGATDVPPEVREPQARVVDFFRRRPWHRWTYNPALRSEVRATVHDQLERFRALYGHEPTHFDGHRHGHIWPNVLIDGGLPPGTRIRKSFTFRAGEKGLGNRAVRRAFNTVIERRYLTTRYFFALPQADSLDGLSGLEGPVEVETHPHWDAERELLLGDAWGSVLGHWSPGSYGDLQNRG